MSIQLRWIVSLITSSAFSFPMNSTSRRRASLWRFPSFCWTRSFCDLSVALRRWGAQSLFCANSTQSRDPSEQLIFFSYKSRHLGTPDNDASYGRLLIVVPGNAEERTCRISGCNSAFPIRERARVRNVSVVSAVAGSGGTFNAYFKDFYRTYRRDGSINIEGRWELGEGDDNCAQCHKSGILPIFPVRGSVSAAEQQALLAVNERFLTYGSPRFGSYLDQRKLGPGLSSASLDDRRQRFGARFDGTPAAKAMVCSSCHQLRATGRSQLADG